MSDPVLVSMIAEGDVEGLNEAVGTILRAKILDLMVAEGLVEIEESEDPNDEDDTEEGDDDDDFEVEETEEDDDK